MRYIITFILASAPAIAEVPSVVTDIPPVHALVAEVMGDLGQPELLLAKGADEHDFQLRPSQMASVAGADLVVWIGPELTPWLDEALAAGQGGATLTLLDKGVAVRDYGEDGGHDHEEHAEGEHAEGDHGHVHHGHDPHAWLDPGNAESWLRVIAAELTRLDPENAAAYQANAAEAMARLKTLDAEVAAMLEPARGKPLATFHDAYGYFGDHYGLDFAGSIALGDAAAPGAARLAELRGEIEGGGVLCIFPEVQHDPALIEQMAEGSGVKVGGALDPVGSSLEPGPGAYGELMTGIARTIADCVGQ